MGAENKARKRAEEIEYEGADVNMFIPLEKKKKKKANSAIGCEHFVKLHSFSDNGPLIAASPGYPSSTRRACGHSFTCHFPK